MDEKEEALLKQINANLNKLISGQNKIFAFLVKPEPLGKRIVKILCDAMAILGGLTIVEVIRNWISGG